MRQFAFTSPQRQLGFAPAPSRSDAQAAAMSSHVRPSEAEAPLGICVGDPNRDRKGAAVGCVLDAPFAFTCSQRQQGFAPVPWPRPCADMLPPVLAFSRRFGFSAFGRFSSLDFHILLGYIKEVIS